MNPILAHWYFHLPNFVLAAIMYTLIGRLLLSLFAPPAWNNYIWRAFVRITDPAVAAVRYVTPEVLPVFVVMIFAVLWIMIIRISFFIALGNLGLLPAAGV